MSFEEADILRRRSHEFLEAAKIMLDKGYYDLAVFNMEQYCQLMLKYVLLVKTGTYPRTHSLTRLINELSKIEPRVKILLEKDEYLIMITKLEDAYIGARYLPRRYSEREAHILYKFVTEVFRKIVEGL
jgi:HEPN domain-containing protein